MPVVFSVPLVAIFIEEVKMTASLDSVVPSTGVTSGMATSAAAAVATAVAAVPAASTAESFWWFALVKTC